MVKSVDVLDDLQETIGAIFEQAQVSLANHKKNCVALYKLHLRASAVTKAGKNGASTKLVGEKGFGDVFTDMVNRVLVVKKGPPTADRIVKFVGSYVQFMNEKVANEKSQSASSSAGSARDSEDVEDTMTTRFISRLLGWLLQGFSAKNKIIRFRCLHFVSELISHIGEVDEDTYDMLREGLGERLNDRETLIRTHAVAALSKLVGSEDPDKMQDGEQSVLDILLEVLATDSAAEVRRAALLNVPISPATIDVILNRTRDVDTITRKIMFTAVLPKLGHPRQLTLVQREQVMKDGLSDREPGVRVAAGKLVTKWFDTILAEAAEAEEDSWIGDDAGTMKGLVKFLALFDVVGPGQTIAIDTLTSIFVTRPDVPDAFIFPEAFWTNLTAESTVLARVFVEHCVKGGHESRLDAASLPVVTAFAFHIQEAYNQLLELLQEAETAKMLRAGLEDEDEDDALEEEIAKQEIILGELLRMALKLDYMDEIGRRKVFSVVKDMLAHPQLPPGLIERCVDVLKEIMPSGRDLIRVIVEIIVELREGDDDGADDVLGNLDDPDQSTATDATSRKDKSLRKPKGRESMTVEERREADVTDIRCLMLCIAVLERVNGSFEDNSTLEGILADLIIPSVKRKELAMREKALVSLGLCCLIAKNMALRSFQLFLGQVENAPADLKVQVLRVILDLLIMYDQDFFRNSEDIAKQITGFLLQTLQAEESPAAQAVLCTGICKLLLAGIITDPNVLTCLALLYISPSTTENQELRQCLSYFFPVYSYASFANQTRIQSTFITAFDHATQLHGELEEGQNMVTPYEFGLLLVDWTDPQKAAHATQKSAEETHNTHVDLAVQILTALYDEERPGEDQKALCQLLAQLHIPPGLDQLSVHKLDILISHHQQQCPFENAAVNKIFSRFKNRFYQLFEAEVKEIEPTTYLQDPEVQKIYHNIAVDMPKEGDAPVKKSRRATTGVQETSDTDASSANHGSTVSPPLSAAPNQSRKEKTDPPKRRAPNGRRKKSPIPQPSDEEQQVSDISDDDQPPAKVAETPKKKSAKRVRTPSSGAHVRKRSRVNGSRSTRSKQQEDTASEDEHSPTPKKPRSTRLSEKAQVRNGRPNARRKAEATLPPSNSDDEQGDEAGEQPKPLEGSSSDELEGFSSE